MTAALGQAQTEAAQAFDLKKLGAQAQADLRKAKQKYGFDVALKTLDFTNEKAINIQVEDLKRKRNSDGSWEEGDPMFFQGTVWNDMAENAAASLQKGMRVVVVGRLNYRSWETQDGQNRSIVDLSIDEIAPSLRWAKANIERVSGGMGASQEPVARENYEEDEAPF